MPNVVKELLTESRVGHVVGIRGIFGLQRTFHVEVDKDPAFNPGFRPEFVMQRFDLVRKDAIVAGSNYPDQPGFIASTFRITKVLNETNFIVRVGYEPNTLTANAPNIVDLWEKEIDYGSETTEVFFDLDGKPIGRPAYSELTEQDLVNPEGPLGPHIYHTQTKSGRIIFLKRDPGFVSAAEQERRGDEYKVSEAERNVVVKKESRQRQQQVANLRLTRDFEVLDDRRRDLAFGSVLLLNDALFAGADRGTLRFDGMTSRDPRTGLDTNRRSPFNVKKLERQTETITLIFGWRGSGWQPEPQVHQWNDGKDNLSLIYDPDPPGGGSDRERQETQYRDFWYGDFNELLQLFD